MDRVKQNQSTEDQFFYQDLVATTGVPDLLFAGGSHIPKNLKNQKNRREKKNQFLILSFTHTLAHTLLSASEAVSPDIVSAI